MQRGSYETKRGWWTLRYRVRVMGRERPVLRAKRLGTVAEFPPKRHKSADDPLGVPNSIRAKGEAFLVEINKTSGRESGQQLSALVRLGEFVESIYLPHVKAQKKPSTYKGYKNIWDFHFADRPNVARVYLRDVQTYDVQMWLNTIEREDKTEDGQLLTHVSLSRIKSLLSGVFRYALQIGHLSGVNPANGTSIPKGRQSDETAAYDLREVQRLIAMLPEPAATCVAIAGYAGLRKSEIRGLLWENYDAKAGTLKVTQSVWQSHIGQPKTLASQDDVPVIPALAAKLEEWRNISDQNGSLGTSMLIFPTSNGTPLDLNNVLNRAILPILERCELCEKPKREHTAADHDYERDASRPAWLGWHALRRGLATNLHDLQVDDLTIQRVLRHSDVSVTRRAYIKRLPKQAVAAMERFQERVAAHEAEAGNTRTQ
jgi:integrase